MKKEIKRHPLYYNGVWPVPFVVAFLVWAFLGFPRTITLPLLAAEATLPLIAVCLYGYIVPRIVDRPGRPPRVHGWEDVE